MLEAPGMRLLLSFALVVSAAAACGGTTLATSTTDGHPDASADAATDAPGDTSPDGGYCCPPDPTPGCCMHYGGYSNGSFNCSSICDGMPEPGDPAWHLTKDSHGCAIWSSTGSTGPLCGQAIGGTDSGITNPPGCPASWSVSYCGAACSQPGITCTYPNGGDALFCNAVDGGGPDGGAGVWACGV